MVLRLSKSLNRVSCTILVFLWACVWICVMLMFNVPLELRSTRWRQTDDHAHYPKSHSNVELLNGFYVYDGRSRATVFNGNYFRALHVLTIYLYWALKQKLWRHTKHTQRHQTLWSQYDKNGKLSKTIDALSSSFSKSRQDSIAEKFLIWVIHPLPHQRSVMWNTFSKIDISNWMCKYTAKIDLCIHIA